MWTAVILLVVIGGVAVYHDNLLRGVKALIRRIRGPA